jgi:hypothetical protein
MELRPPLPTAKSAKSFRDKGLGAQVPVLLTYS